ncbi:MAG TPA: D-amino-acid transaminase [Rhizomicrobium sp.]|jgi:D-alanine transaminase|nr:D-amino-acid transaminase [Rhizomicrobium sp.]
MPEAHSRARVRVRPVGRIAYIDGRYVRHDLGTVHIEDRGLQFADSIYEVFGVFGGKVFDEDQHLDRLERSLGEIALPMPMARRALKLVVREIARRNRLADGLIYMQVTRGAARRDHAIPQHPQPPSVILTARPVDTESFEGRRRSGIKVITTADERWARCDIKSTALLPNVLAKTKARGAGAYEAWLVDREGRVTEGSSTTAWIVDKDGKLVTRDLDNAVLPGVTRRILMEVAESAQLPVAERRFTVSEAKTAREAFITAATIGALPVVEIDGTQIGDGTPGPVARRLHELYRHAAETAAEQV